MRKHKLKKIQISPAENRYPNCVRMEWEANPLEGKQGNLFNRTEENSKIELCLNILFGEQELEFPQSNTSPDDLLGKVKFGIKGGRLKLKHEGCLISYKDVKHIKAIEPFLEEESQSETGGEIKGGLEVSPSGIKFSFNPGIVHKTGTKVKKKKYRLWLEHFSEKSLIWCFAEPVNFFLQGSLQEEDKKFVTSVQLTELPCNIEATFEVQLADIFLTGGEVYWSIPSSKFYLKLQNIDDRNKLAMIETLFVHKVLDRILMLPLYLSHQELKYV